jgi:hypothetical protein
MFYGKEKTIYFGPMLVTAHKSEKGAVQLRYLDVDKENDTAKVLEKCTLKDKLKVELRLMEYPENSYKNTPQAGTKMHSEETLTRTLTESE